MPAPCTLEVIFDHPGPASASADVGLPPAARRFPMGLRCTSCGAPLPGDLPHAVVESRCSRCRTGSAAVANTPQPAPARTDNPQGRGRAILLIALLSVAFLAALIVGLTICLSGSGSPEEEKHGQVVQGPPPVEDSSPKKADTPLDLQPVPPPLTPAEKERNALHHSVTFMDSVGKGRRFCIIADSSNSMKGPPLERCKQEVLKTLKSLTPESQFYVSFFNKVPEPMPYASWLDGNKANVDKVTSWVEKITPALGTKPVPAFTKAF